MPFPPHCFSGNWGYQDHKCRSASGGHPRTMSDAEASPDAALLEGTEQVLQARDRRDHNHAGISQSWLLRIYMWMKNNLIRVPACISLKERGHFARILPQADADFPGHGQPLSPCGSAPPRARKRSSTLSMKLIMEVAPKTESVSTPAWASARSPSYALLPAL